MTLVHNDGNLVFLCLYSVPLSTAETFEDANGIDIKSYFNLRHITRCKRYACEFKLSNQAVILGCGLLAFMNLNEHTRLVVKIDGKGLCLFGRIGSIVLDKDGHDPTSSFNAKGKKSGIQQQQIWNIFRFVSRWNSCLDS